MYTKQTTIINETGIHARPAGGFVQEAKNFTSNITVKNVTSGGNAVNAKSIIRIMGEEFIKGSIIEISADGEDEQEAVNSLIALVESGFGE